MNKKLIILTDIGDTIVDEGTEIRKEEGGVVYHADCVPGAKETFLELHRLGFTIAMVADGLEESFRNTMEENGLSHVFQARIISEHLGVEKPHPLMFETALARLGLSEEDKDRIIMVGNNLSRDMVGANRFGIRSVHFCWSKRYPKAATNIEEEPTYRIYQARELIDLAERLEKELEEKAKK